MTDAIIVNRPVPALAAGHLSEAQRALEHSHGAVDDNRVRDALWIARALPVALDALADTRSGRALETTQLRPMWVERHPSTKASTVLESVATYSPGSDRLEVEIWSEPRPTEAGARPIAVVRFRVASTAPPRERADDEITLRRFSLP